MPVSDTALGSVGSTSTLVTLFTGFLIGMGNGVNVRVAQHLGAQHREETSRAVHTAFLLCLLAGLGIMALCLALATNMLEMLHTKDDLLPGAVLYFRIYALGMPALGVFNFGNAVLSANGDTKRPLLYLTIAGILNVILNLFFVIVCQDGGGRRSVGERHLAVRVSHPRRVAHDAPERRLQILFSAAAVPWRRGRAHSGDSASRQASST